MTSNNGLYDIKSPLFENVYHLIVLATVDILQDCFVCRFHHFIGNENPQGV